MNYMSIRETRSLNASLTQSSSVIIRPIHDEAGSYYTARVLEFGGWILTENSCVEAHEAIYEVVAGFIEDMMENDEEIPEPIGDDHFSGNLRVRMPKSLHRDLSQAAKLEGVSLNQYIINKLSK